MLLVPALTMLDYKVEQFLRRTLHLEPSESDGLPQEEVSLVAPAGSTAGRHGRTRVTRRAFLGWTPLSTSTFPMDYDDQGGSPSDDRTRRRGD